MWGFSAPASSDSNKARPAPDQPRSGLIAQSWVRLRSRPAVVLVSSCFVRLGLGLPGSLRQVRSVWGVLAPAPSDSDAARPAPDLPRSGLIAQSWVRLRPESAACEAPAPSDLDMARPASPSSGFSPGPHLRPTRIRPATSGLIAQSWILVQ